MIKLNDILHGFRVKKQTEIPEIKATLHEMEYEKCGARLLFLDREDSNKTFSIAFKTIPEDSTGIFHIIEHSVLCGSKKYPVKEPFVELLKGSLQTFLNAMTFPDKTMYPISSRNDKDYLNLMSVYMDAVLHPAILENPNIFRQEGWHFELEGEDGELGRSGVVLNEMKGSFSSADELANYHITNMLYPDTCYRHESGGEPHAITDLTYEQFVEGHRKYYHPSNSEIFLDGSVDLDSALSLLDSYLSEYDRLEIDFDIADQPAIKPVSREVEYEIAPNESKENKTRLVMGYLTSRFDEQEKNLAITVLSDALCSSNESPIKKAILESGLCEDVSVYAYDSIKQNSFNIDFRNVKDGREEELYRFFVDTVERICREGIDRSNLEAALNSFEFKMREKDFGTMPRGIIYAMSVLESSLYGGDPVQNLSYSESFASLRRKLNTDYYEKLLLSIITENEHRATLVMRPSATLGEERAAKEKEELAKIKASLSKEELLEIIRINGELKAWQKTDDTPEKLATLPALTRDDISDKVEAIPREISEVLGRTVLSHNIVTDGIAYTELYFDVSDLTEAEIFDVRILLSLITNARTEKRGAIELQNLIKAELGSFDARLSAVTNEGEAKIYIVVSASALDSKKDKLVEIVSEILYSSVYSDYEVMRNIVRQMKMASDDSFAAAGHAVGIGRAGAYVSAENAVMEYYSGYEAHLRIKNLERDFDALAEGFIDRVSRLPERLFTRERLTLSLVGSPDSDFARKLILMTNEGEKYNPVCNIKPLGVRKEGILIPAQVSFAEMVANLSEIGEKLCGSLNVARNLLSFGYLWNAVRVQGGAYGVGFLARNNGNVGFYSYRDPSPARTVGCYKESSEFLRAFAASGEDITKFIIGAVGDAEPLATPRLKGVISATRYLRGISYEDECKTRREMLATDSAELIRIADILDKVRASAGICIVAGKDKLDECGEIIDTILEI